VRKVDSEESSQNRCAAPGTVPGGTCSAAGAAGSETPGNSWAIPPSLRWPEKEERRWVYPSILEAALACNKPMLLGPYSFASAAGASLLRCLSGNLWLV